jgi:hypothetical protein
MSEVDDLRRYLSDGFQPMMLLRDVDEEELRRQGLPSGYVSGCVKALPLTHSDGRRLMFYLKEQETVEFAREIVRDLGTIIGYTLYVYCSVIGPDITEAKDVDLGQVIASLRESMLPLLNRCYWHSSSREVKQEIYILARGWTRRSSPDLANRTRRGRLNSRL